MSSSLPSAAPPPASAPSFSSADGTSASSSFVGFLFNAVLMPLAFPLVQRNLVPDFLLRMGARALCREMLARQKARSLSQQVADKAAYVADLRARGVLAVATADANKQHYEVPAAFFELVMGKHKKYSCGLWPELEPRGAAAAAAAPATTLDASEELALRLVCERAKLEDVAGTRVLDMGCGWGSFTLFAAARFPRVSFTALSNSASQKRFIDAQAAARGLANVEVVTCDINDFTGAGRSFDRVVSIEMMEHVKVRARAQPARRGAARRGAARSMNHCARSFVRNPFPHPLSPSPSLSLTLSPVPLARPQNYELLLQRVASWMRPGGLMFVHIFTHRAFPFHYEKGWMADNFFAGGQMPSDDLLLHFQRDLRVADHWLVQGTHYEKTCNAWLAQMDANKARVMPVLAGIYGEANKTAWYVNWRLFFIACAELFGFDNGNEWAVSHYLLEKPAGV